MYSAFMTEKKCQSKCKLDQSNLICLGCGRTLEEIINAGLNSAIKDKAQTEDGE